MGGKSYTISSMGESPKTRSNGENWTTKTLLGRTPLSWVKIIVFYIIYYTCLTGFSILSYYIFSKTLNDKAPKWTLKESLIGDNPGVGFRPLPDQGSNAESSLIWYNHKSNSDAKFWYSQLDDFVKKSSFPENTDGVVNCFAGSKNTDASCTVPVNQLKKCTSENHFGYLEGKPCVLVKLNRIYGWKPEPFGIKDGQYDKDTLRTDLDKMVKEEGMSVSLKELIKREVEQNLSSATDVLKTVWISCQGENVADKESLPEESISYEPLQGIPGYYFPYLNQKNYRSPFVMVKLDIPVKSRHVLINVECRAWAKNIKYDKVNRLGSVHFEVMID